jgi:cell division protein FtsN
MARRGKENFRFSTVELGALAVSYTITSVLVFLLGFYVGRKVSAEHAPVAENVARVPVGAPPSETAAPRPASRTSQPPAATALTPTASAAAASATAKTPLATTTPAAKTAAAAPASPPAPGQHIPAAQAIAKTSGTAAPALTPPAPAKAPTAAAAAPPPKVPPGVPFTVQVLATRNRAEADSLSANLKRKGLGAYVAAVQDANGTWYRVRIGHFEDAESARKTAERASREYGLTQAYVSPIYSDAR